MKRQACLLAAILMAGSALADVWIVNGVAPSSGGGGGPEVDPVWSAASVGVQSEIEGKLASDDSTYAETVSRASTALQEEGDPLSVHADDAGYLEAVGKAATALQEEADPLAVHSDDPTYLEAVENAGSALQAETDPLAVHADDGTYLDTVSKAGTAVQTEADPLAVHADDPAYAETVSKAGTALQEEADPLSVHADDGTYLDTVGKAASAVQSEADPLAVHADDAGYLATVQKADTALQAESDPLAVHADDSTYLETVDKAGTALQAEADPLAVHADDPVYLGAVEAANSAVQVETDPVWTGDSPNVLRSDGTVAAAVLPVALVTNNEALGPDIDLAPGAGETPGSVNVRVAEAGENLGRFRVVNEGGGLLDVSASGVTAGVPFNGDAAGLTNIPAAQLAGAYPQTGAAFGIENEAVLGSLTMGKHCRAVGFKSFAGGHGAVASNDECFVWAATSQTRSNYYDHGDGTFSVYAPGGVWIGHSKLYVDGNGFVRALPPTNGEGWYTLGGDTYTIDPGAIPTWPGWGTHSYWDPEIMLGANPCNMYWGDSPDRQNQDCSW